MAARCRACQPGLPLRPAGGKMGAMTARDKEREERLAAALRENLRKRKAQARVLEQGVIPAKAGTPGPEGGTAE